MGIHIVHNEDVNDGKNADIWFRTAAIILKKREGEHVMDNAMKLLVCAGALLLLIAGAIFGVLGQWLYAALIWAGGFCCLAAALNFKNRKGK